MGCTSSSESYIDPATGQQKTKHSLGGAYPGQRRPQTQSYTPQESQFGSDGTATVHFKAYGSGNALTLVQADGSNKPQVGKPDKYIQVTLPDGVKEGQTIHVKAPDGRLNAIVVPYGFGPGSTFTVEFDEAGPGKSYGQTSTTTSSQQPEQAAYTPPPPSGDDGFATGFGNPNYRPQSSVNSNAQTNTKLSTDHKLADDVDIQVYPTASAIPEPNIVLSPDHKLANDLDINAYPSASAAPVYPSPPQYPQPSKF